MALTQKEIAHRITHLRMLKQASVDDCAAVLDVSEDEYRRFEEGETTLTLPEIVLLSLFLDVPTRMIFEENQRENLVSSFLDNSERSAFKTILHKIIRAKIVIEMNQRAVTMTDLYNATGIPLETLEMYKDGSLPLPIDHLCQISATLNIPKDTFFNQEWKITRETGLKSDPEQWIPEYPEDEFSADSFDNHPLQNF